MFQNKPRTKYEVLPHRERTKYEVLPHGTRAQGMVVDLLMLIIVSTILFIILSSQMSHQAPDAGVIRSKSTQIQRTLITLLNAEADNSTSVENATIAELIGMKYCGNDTFSDLNKTVQNTMNRIIKTDSYFIFSFCGNGDCTKPKSGVCSPSIESNFSCCIKTDKITVARLNLNLPEGCSKKYVAVEIGIWPKNVGVESCES